MASIKSLKRGVFNIEKTDLKFNIEYYGNWNLKYPGEPKVKGKPLGIICAGDLEINLTHRDVWNIIKLYHDADIESIKLIKDGKSGACKNFELPFAFKLKELIEKMQNEAQELF